MSKYYLAYGSNLNKEQMAYRCPDAVPVGTGRIDNYELVFRRGVLTIERKDGAFVPVGCWQISDADEARLDRYEGYPRFYYKEDFLISCEDGKTRRFMAYIMQDGHPIQAPSDGYLTVCRIGYKDFGFDLDPLMAAYERAKWPEDYTTVSTTEDGQK